MKARLAVDALEMAVVRLGDVGGCKIHSDRGSQFRSKKFTRALARHGIIGSMGRVGAWDNAVAENFFSHLKTEFYHPESFSTRLEARTAVMEYIEVWYNSQRPNARVGYTAPAVAWAEYEGVGQDDLAE